MPGSTARAASDAAADVAVEGGTVVFAGQPLEALDHQRSHAMDERIERTRFADDPFECGVNDGIVVQKVDPHGDGARSRRFDGRHRFVGARGSVRERDAVESVEGQSRCDSRR